MSVNSADPLVSIIVITYNSAKYVLETLESAKAQTYQNIELIISDDSSKDETVKICRLWLEENKNRFVRTELITAAENTGIPANCNRGVRASNGEWIKLIAGDDILTENALKLYIDYVTQNLHINIIHSNVQRFVVKDNNKQFYQVEDRTGLLFNQNETSAKLQFQILLRFNPVYAPSVFLRKKIVIELGIFIEKYRIWEDRPAWLALTLNNERFYFLNAVTIHYRINSTSVLGQKSNKIYSDFHLLQQEYLMDFNKYLPFKERTIRVLGYKRILLLCRLGFNRVNFFDKSIDIITRKPFFIIERRFIKKYL